jgi:predicted O-methyltransferase YrrM
VLSSIFDLSLRRVQLGLNRLASQGLSALQSQAQKIDIYLDRVGEIEIASLQPIPFAAVDLTREADPIEAIVAASEFVTTSDYFAKSRTAQRSLISACSQGLLFTLLRNLRPDHVVEIGVYKAASTEAMCRAMAANGHGTVHAVDPFRTEYVSAVLKRWPENLLRHVKFHPVDSMSFFFDLPKHGIRPGLVLVDGNHDYEFALFDITAAARHLKPGGFIFIDNVSLPGPFQATRNFLAGNPAWVECGGSAVQLDTSAGFGPHRSCIENTDCIILRAPNAYVVDGRSRSFEITRQVSNRCRGIRLFLAQPASRGVLCVQTKLAGFGMHPAEAIATEVRSLDPGSAESITVTLDPPAQLDGVFAYCTVEPWLSWQSDRPLLLREPPQPF